ncbi:MAG: cupin domain-containing protein [Candidatus Korobacteraceae bacterium]|jgi:mannose-6-phosphate isomerase-like protein (cupin superfamily)
MDISNELVQPINRQRAEHYIWRGNCDGWHLVKQPQLSVIEERMTPGASEVRHHHVHARQFFYALHGELTLEVEGREYLLRPGDGLEIAPGKQHQAFNRSGSDVRMLVVSQPPSHGDRVVSG